MAAWEGGVLKVEEDAVRGVENHPEIDRCAHSLSPSFYSWGNRGRSARESQGRVRVSVLQTPRKSAHPTPIHALFASSIAPSTFVH